MHARCWETLGNSQCNIICLFVVDLAFPGNPHCRWAFLEAPHPSLASHLRVPTLARYDIIVYEACHLIQSLMCSYRKLSRKPLPWCLKINGNGHQLSSYDPCFKLINPVLNSQTVKLFLLKVYQNIVSQLKEGVLEMIKPVEPVVKLRKAGSN